MSPEKDYPQYQSSHSVHLFMKYLGVALFFGGVICELMPIFTDDTRIIDQLLIWTIVFLEFLVLTFKSDVFFKRVADNRLTRLFMILAYALIIIFSFIRIPFGFVLQTVGIVYAFTQWLVAVFSTRKKVFESFGCAILFLSIFLFAIDVVQQFYLLSLEVVVPAVLLISVVLYCLLPEKYRVNIGLVSIDKKTSIERLPSRHNKSKHAFGILRGLLFGCSLYIVLQSSNAEPSEALLHDSLKLFFLLIFSAILIVDNMATRNCDPQKQTALFHDSLFLIVPLLVIMSFVEDSFSRALLSWILLCFTLRACVCDLVFCNNWSYLFKASPIPSVAHTLLPFVFSIILGWGMSYLSFYFEGPFFGNFAISSYQIVFIVLIVLLIRITTHEMALRYNNTQQEIQSLLEVVSQENQFGHEDRLSGAESATELSSEDSVSHVGEYDTAARKEKLRAAINSFDFTNRQIEVLVYLLQGRNASYISNQLFISLATARSHIQSIYKKVDVHSQQKLIEYFDEQVKQ